MNKLFIICMMGIFFLSMQSKDSDLVLEKNPTLQGIILSNQNFKDTSGKSCQGVRIHNLLVPGKKLELQEKLKKFLHKEITEDLVDNIKQTILQYYQTKKHPLVVVKIPDQDITNGIIRFIIIEAKLGRVNIKDNKWNNEKDIQKEIRLKPGEPIDTNLLTQDLYWLNRNPFRQSYVIYTPGKWEGTTDVEVHVKDRLPIRVYGGIDNIGNYITGYNRMFAGLVLGNLWKDQMLSYQYTTGSTLKKFQSHFLQYTIPFSWRHQLLLIGGYSYYKVNYEVDGIEGVFHSHGMSLQGSARYDIPFVLMGYLTDVTCGFDFKRTNNNVEFSEEPVFGAYANLTQFMAGYNMGGCKNWMEWNVQIEGFWSPGRWVADQTNSKYNTIRAYAKNQYAYLRSSSNVNFIMGKDFLLDMYLRWQLANQNLLPSEMYGLGGFDTVRGYKERVYNGDHAVVYNVEIKSPQFSLFGSRDKGKWRILGFFDMGYAWKNHKAPGERESDGLFSIGPGLRYAWLPYVTARLDWGFQLKTRDEYGIGHNRGHFSVIIGF